MKINLRELRLENNISVRGLAKLSGVSASAISRIENEGVTPSLLTICKLRCALNVGIEKMVDCEEE